MPTFLLGELLLLGLFYELHLAGFNLFPARGYVALTGDPVDWAQHLLLPWLTIALVSAATYYAPHPGDAARACSARTTSAPPTRRACAGGG